MSEDKKNIRIVVSLDGGGTKGLYSLEILEHLAKLIGCDFTEYVDLFGGTSTGGILSIAKSRQISNEELLKLYEGEESKKIFGGLWDEFKGVLSRGEMFNSEELIKIVNQWFSTPDGASDSSQKNFFVVSLTKTGENKEILTPVIISNYQLEETKEGPEDVIRGEVIKRLYTIGEKPLSLADAVRATSSIPAAFQKHKQDDIEYLDGGFKYNNPVEIAYHEAKILYPKDYIVIISIGCTDKDVEGLTEKNKEVNDRLQNFLDDYEDGVTTKKVLFKGSWIKDLRECMKLFKQSKSSQQLYLEAMEIIKDDQNAFVLRFDSAKTHSLLSFSDTSKKFFNELRECSTNLSKDKEFTRTSSFLKKIIELKNQKE
ncbi:hypothetical protein RB653_004532 [Dictyostelium firmibasis]|uniref:PNPLA domain-containing protein n=1 Tax=Dictyostelium firmibasis TaxID=79012 RepID=A0AAN7U9V8_9MYCE